MVLRKFILNLRCLILTLSEGIRENTESLTKAYSKYRLAEGK